LRIKDCHVIGFPTTVTPLLIVGRPAKAGTDQGEQCLRREMIEHCTRIVFLNSVDKHLTSRPKLLFRNF